MSYLRKQDSLLNSIEQTLSSIEHLALQYSDVSAEIASWFKHFNHLWDVLSITLGWGAKPSRRKKLLNLLFPNVNSFETWMENIRMRSPILDTPDLSLPFPPNFAVYPTAYGFQLCSNGLDDWEFLASGHYLRELAETLIVLRILPAIECFIDIGSNIGFFSLLAAAQTADSFRVIACEPSPDNFRRLTEAIQLNGYGNKITAMPIAIADKEGEAELHESRIGSGGNSLSPSAQHLFFSQTIPVPTLSLDSIRSTHLLRHKKVFIKIDVEGTEYDVFQGGKEWMEDPYPPVYLFEAWPNSPRFAKDNHLKIIHLLQKAGYQVYAINQLQHNKHLLKPIPSFSASRPSIIGNYLALPHWAYSLMCVIDKGCDMRIFTDAKDLAAIERFLIASLSNLQRFVQTLPKVIKDQN